MSILEADFQLCANQLNHMSQNVDMHMRDVTSGLHTISHNIQDVASELSSVAYGISEVNARLDMLLNEFIEFRTESFIQNEVRNNHLQQIEMTLKNPNKTEALELFHTGIELIQRKQVRLSLDYLLKAKQLNPLHYRTYIYLAAAYSLLNEHDTALQYAMDSLSHAPTDSDFNYKSTSYQLIGKIYYHKGQYEEAYNYVNNALHIYQNASLYYDKSRYASLIKRTQEAEDYLEKAIKENRVFFNLALVDTAFVSLGENRTVLLERIKVEAQQTLKNYTASISKIKMPTQNEVQQILQSSNMLEDGLINIISFTSKMPSLKGVDLVIEKYRYCHKNLSKAMRESQDSINHYNQTMNSISKLLSSEHEELAKQISTLPNYCEGTYENIQNGLDRAVMFKEHLLTFPNRLDEVIQAYRTHLINIFNDAQGSRNSWVGGNARTIDSYCHDLDKVDNELKTLKDKFIKFKRVPFFSDRKKEMEKDIINKEMQVFAYAANAMSIRHYKYGYSLYHTRIPQVIELYKTGTKLK
ncbi:tetratricopeptide repeat protein [Bacillus cereus group sp. TH152-1LC]|uniref:tetratricopeptide repeat protein n=1 Tax=Bacillus cereus group sp. TH152-1LC TaxID=3018060 RepID=UPI0022E2A8E7|nr:hypothetical protein [Bacillus cereus group sp. TH152-1LC]MDA1675339.1 hypothetical protein [Bacillus cereus group sp. TH152-1LC]